MKNFKWIIRENIPCWYELSWREKEPAIILRAHRDFVSTFPVLLEDNPLVVHYTDKFKFKGFSGDLTKDFGFTEGVFRNQGENNGFVEYLVLIPEIKTKTNEPCKECKGTGKDLFSKEFSREDRDCAHCNGDGKEVLNNWKPINAVSATFTHFFRFAHLSEKETSASLPQLMTMITETHSGKHGAPISGEISIPLRNCLALLEDNVSLPEVTKATKAAYTRMFGGLHHLNEHYFRAHSRGNGGFIIDCPGNACDLHPSEWNRPEGKGYQFGCHNVDNTAQQITLLAGLAALHDKARREIS